MSTLTSTVSSTLRIDKVIRLRGEQLAKKAGFNPDKLYTRNQKHKLTIIRGAMMYHLRFSCKYTLREIGEIFNRTPYACSYWSQKLYDLESIQDADAMKILNYIKP